MNESSSESTPAPAHATEENPNLQDASAADQASTPPASDTPSPASDDSDSPPTGETEQTQQPEATPPAETGNGADPPATDNAAAASNPPAVDPPAGEPANAPAFQEPPASDTPSQPVDVPSDPDGSMLVMLTREALRNRIPMVQTGSLNELLTKVAQDEQTLRACSVLQRRLIQHVGTGTVTQSSLEDVLQGEEAQEFAARGLPGAQLLAYFQEVTPEVVRLLRQPAV